MKNCKTYDGPEWRVATRSVMYGVQIIEDSISLRQGSRVICTMPEKGKGRTAHAHLIAAAPELLSACIDAASVLTMHDQHSRTLNILLTTIAKAEGK